MNISVSFSGDSYHSLMYLFRIPVCTISKIVPEVCKALYDTLHEEYLKVSTINITGNQFIIIINQLQDAEIKGLVFGSITMFSGVFLIGTDDYVIYR